MTCNIQQIVDTQTFLFFDFKIRPNALARHNNKLTTGNGFLRSVVLVLFFPVALAIGLVLRPTVFYFVALFLLSILFYTWSAKDQVWILLVSVLLNYFGGLSIAARGGRWRLAVFVGANLALLAYYKYAYFFATLAGLDAAGGGMDWLSKLALPIGISFFTFQGISYLIDIHRGQIRPERDFFVFGAYLTFFPQLIAGPIVRYDHVKRYLQEPLTDGQSFAGGAARFSHGLLKKLLVADTLAVIADAAFSLPDSEVTFAVAALGALAYTLQIYFDFSGYSDMAIGLGLMFGIRFNENFLHPYSAGTLTDFWRRWHISLSSWFRDYLYIPLGGNRSGAWVTYRNLAIVFLATGLWHGAAWTFVAWGIYHGAFLIAERLIWGRKAGEQGGSLALRFLYCIPAVMVGWIIFRAETIGQAATFVGALMNPFAENAFFLPPTLMGAAAPSTLAVLALASLIFFAPRHMTVGQLLLEPPAHLLPAIYRISYMGAGLAVAGTLAMALNFSPFLYFRF